MGKRGVIKDPDVLLSAKRKGGKGLRDEERGGSKKAPKSCKRELN